MPYLVLIAIGLLGWAACSALESDEEEAFAARVRAAQEEQRLQWLQELEASLADHRHLLDCLSDVDGSHQGIVQDVRLLLYKEWDKLEVVSRSFELGQTSVVPENGDGPDSGGAHALQVTFSARNRFRTRENPAEKRHFVASATFADECDHDPSSVTIAERRRAGTFRPFHDLSPSDRSALRRTLREQMQ